jgi:DNA-binding transcriptional MerR regulator
VPLKGIRSLLRKGFADLPRALAAQRGVLDAKMRLLDKAIQAIGDAEAMVRSGSGDAGNSLRRIIEVIEMQNNRDEWKTKYDALVQGKIERLKAMSAETRAALQTQWADLLKDVDAALGDDPSSATAQALASRWLSLLAVFSDGVTDPQLVKSFAAAYDKPSPGMMSGIPIDSRIWEFMGKALAARQ